MTMITTTMLPQFTLALSVLALDAIDDETLGAWVDDDHEVRIDPLDLDCVPFDETIETQLAEGLYEEDLIASGHYEPLESWEKEALSVPVAQRPAYFAMIDRMNWEA
jgi:hypothetical protein